MIVTLIVICEVSFWVLLAAGLAARYLFRLQRTSVVLLLCEPLLEIVLLIATSIDLRNGAKPDWEHGLAAVYIGFTVAYGHYTISRLDGWAAHRFADAPPPPKPPKYGLPRARHEGKLWLRTLLAGAVACALLQLAIWYVGSGTTAAEALRLWQMFSLNAIAIHGVIAMTYLLWPKKAPVGAAQGRRGDG
ncbi:MULTISPECIES: hypothetical protein [Streptomyces]|uniref:2TM domain-containing protein n=2 Tax=Streptomyces TaxID=1883 RepID=A0A3R7HH52_9ACTN|nr:MULTISPECIES: hypothetical protein [Streptomyces]KNE81925.1 membrane protein [Streptomyces fradiae]OFA51568.1 hypothetical protein BEN35_13460 [Streptomyces fradiae]PQM19423.1 hypothetical protein Sfr7A_32345 [Streptomyces xinghaiensis]RKM95958.1 hypothetical protein SFRA_013200 [Streptomyces xinghaiensis]RNC69914.1 hypothetical protein DC095_027085 [Streptomyces xinghaiensis]